MKYQENVNHSLRKRPSTKDNLKMTQMLEFYSGDISYDYYQEIKKNTLVFNNIESIIRKNKIILKKWKFLKWKMQCQIHMCICMYI